MATGYIDFESQSSGNVVYAGDLDLTGVIEIIACFVPRVSGVVDWTPSTGPFRLISKGTAAQPAYEIQLQADGKIQWSYYDGATEQKAYSAVISPSGDHSWVRVVYDNVVPDVNFYYSNDAIATAAGSVSWTQSGTVDISMTGTPQANNENVQIGRRQAAGALFEGEIFYVEIKGGGSTRGLCDFRTTSQGDWGDMEDGGVGTAVSDGYGNDWYVENYTNITYVTGSSPVTLTPNGDQTRSAVIKETGGITDLYQSVDDDPDTPVLTDYIFTQGIDGSVFFDLSNTPGDFSSISTLQVRADIKKINTSGATVTTYAQVFDADEITNWTDEVMVATQATADGLQEADFVVNATGLAATKAQWDAARLKLRWDFV